MPTFRPALIALWLYSTLEIATGYTLNVTCSGNRMTVFVDGVNYFGGNGTDFLPTASPANTVQTIYVPQDNVNIVAIMCINHISSAYVKAAGSVGLVTDASWLCEVDANINFADIGFNDSDWTPAKLKESYDPVLNTSSASLPVNAQWLTQYSDSAILLCRQHTGNNMCLTSNPCQNGGSCATMPTGDMQCWCTSAFTGVNCETTIPTTTTITTTPSPTTTTIPPTTTTTTTTTPPLTTTTTLPPTTTTKSTTTTTATTTTTTVPTTTITTTLRPTTTTTTLPPTTTTVTTTPTSTTTATTTTTTTTTATSTTSTTVSTSSTTTSVTTPMNTTHPASSTATSISTTTIKVTTASASSGTENSSNIGNSDIVLAGSTSTISGFTFSSITTDSGDSVTRKSPSPYLSIIVACFVAGGVALILVIICLLCILCRLKH